MVTYNHDHVDVKIDKYVCSVEDLLNYVYLHVWLVALQFWAVVKGEKRFQTRKNNASVKV